MTKIVFFKEGDEFYGFEEQGHTGYSEEGDDILCSAISAMTMLVINAVMVAYASDVDYQVDDETTNIRVRSKAALSRFEKDEKKRYAVGGLFMAYYYQLMDLTEDYYDFLDVDTVEKPWDSSQ